MGAEQSNDRGELGEDLDLVNGFHILKVKPNSPCEQAGLSPYFDFIISINNNSEISTLQEFAKTISNFVNLEVKLLVFSIKTRTTREVSLYPNIDWSPNPKDGMLGCSVRYSTVEKGLECVWHILEVQIRSPAERAGLQPFTDYIVGCEYRNLDSDTDFYELIQDHQDKLLSLLVYNSVWDNCREVVIIPKLDWGGEGLLGCGVGSGLLHRIPIKNISKLILSPPNEPITSPIQDQPQLSDNNDVTPPKASSPTHQQDLTSDFNQLQLSDEALPIDHPINDNSSNQDDLSNINNQTLPSDDITTQTPSAIESNLISNDAVIEPSDKETDLNSYPKN